MKEGFEETRHFLQLLTDSRHLSGEDTHLKKIEERELLKNDDPWEIVQAGIWSSTFVSFYPSAWFIPVTPSHS